MGPADRWKWVVHRLVVFVIPVVFAFPGVVVPERHLRIDLWLAERLLLYAILATVLAVVAFGVTFLMLPPVAIRLKRAGQAGLIACLVYVTTLSAAGAVGMVAEPAGRGGRSLLEDVFRGLAR